MYQTYADIGSVKMTFGACNPKPLKVRNISQKTINGLILNVKLLVKTSIQQNICTN
jgi:hypothetical protein